MAESSSTTGETRLARKPADKNRILSSALKLFYQNGYHATSMQDLADDVGVLKGSLYYHINNKEELLLTLLTASIDDVYTKVSAAAAGEGTPRELLRKVISAELVTVASHQKEIALWQTERRRARELLHEIGVKVRLTDDILRNLLNEGADAGEWPRESLDTAYQAIQGMVVWFTSWYKPEGSLALDRVVSRFADYAEAIVDA